MRTSRLKLLVFTLIIGFCFSQGIAQTKKPPVKKPAPKPVAAPVISELSEAEWKNLINALVAEDWKNSAALAAQYLQKLKTDNEKKQLAQLRYFYLYSLAGKILEANAAPAAIDDSALWKDLSEAISAFVGQEIVSPPRRFLPECKEVLNYICPVKSNEKALRVAATNKEGTTIHSFDYVLFDEKFSTEDFTDKEVFLGGKLKKAEFNQDLSKAWVMRLFFDNGFVKIVG